MLNLDDALKALAAEGALVETFRRACRPEQHTLAPGMAAVIGKATRQRIPLLGVALEALTSKLFVKRMSTARATPTKALSGWLTANRWELLERDLFTAALRDGRAFLLVTYGEAPRVTLRPAYNGSEGATLLPNGTPINVYVLDGVRCCDVFYADRIEKCKLWQRSRHVYSLKTGVPSAPFWRRNVLSATIAGRHERPHRRVAEGCCGSWSVPLSTTFTRRAGPRPRSPSF